MGAQDGGVGGDGGGEVRRSRERGGVIFFRGEICNEEAPITSSLSVDEAEEKRDEDCSQRKAGRCLKQTRVERCVGVGKRRRAEGELVEGAWRKLAALVRRAEAGQDQDRIRTGQGIRCKRRPTKRDKEKTKKKRGNGKGREKETPVPTQKKTIKETSPANRNQPLQIGRAHV